MDASRSNEANERTKPEFVKVRVCSFANTKPSGLNFHTATQHGNRVSHVGAASTTFHSRIRMISNVISLAAQLYQKAKLYPLPDLAPPACWEVVQTESKIVPDREAWVIVLTCRGVDRRGKSRLGCCCCRQAGYRTIVERLHRQPPPTAESHANMPADAPPQDVKRKAAREVIDILHEIATLLVRVLKARSHHSH